MMEKPCKHRDSELEKHQNVYDKEQCQQIISYNT